MGYDALFQVEDEDQPFYRCRSPQGPHAGKDIGFEPMGCDVYKAPAEEEGFGSHLRDQLRAWENRMRSRAVLGQPEES